MKGARAVRVAAQPYPDLHGDQRTIGRTAVPRVGVVIVTYNGLARTVECLSSLAAVEYAARTIVVVDNASDDGTPVTILREFPEAILLPQRENLGFTGGSNVGIRWCLDQGCDAVLLLNSDTRVDPKFLDAMVARLERACIVAPEIRSTERTHEKVEEIAWFDWQRGSAVPLALGRHDQDELPSRIASGCCLLVDREVFETVGLLDENFFLYYEDVDFVVRAQIAGFELVREPRAIIYHHEDARRGDLSGSPLKIYYNTRNRLYLMRKHSRATAGFLGYFFATRLIYAVRYVVAGKRPLLVSMIRGVRDFLTGRLARAEYRW